MNEHIETFLKYYCDPKRQLNYAVLITGRWGSGKTHYIKRYIEKHSSPSRPYLYITLHGLERVEQIDQEIFRQLHPILSSRGMALATRALKGMVRGVLKIDLDDKKELEISANLPSLNLSESLYKKDCILIFDDLERCRIKMPVLLGYINYFVEHDDQKVIIIADEDKAPRIVGAKEKLIGQTLEFEPNFQEAIQRFIEVLDNNTSKQFLSRNVSSIEELFQLSGHQNLRVVRQTLLSFDRLYSALSEATRAHEETMRTLFRVFFAISLEFRIQTLTKKDLQHLSQNYASAIMSDPNSQEASRWRSVWRKYGDLEQHISILSDQLWRELLCSGSVPAQAITDYLDKIGLLGQPQTPPWRILWYYHRISEDQFTTALNSVLTSLENAEYSNEGEVFHCYGLALALAEDNLLPVNIDRVIGWCRTNLLKILREHARELDIYDDEFISPVTGWGGLAFHHYDDPKFEEMLQWRAEQRLILIQTTYREVARESLEIMKSNPNRFADMITFRPNSDNKYYRLPIFSRIDAESFAEAFLAATPEGQWIIGRALKARYENGALESILSEEKCWLNSLYRLLATRQYSSKLELARVKAIANYAIAPHLKR